MESYTSALDAYFGLPKAPLTFELFDGDVVGLARVTDRLTFPGLPYADASDEGALPRRRFQCLDGEWKTVYPLLRLRHHPATRRYEARDVPYAALRDLRPVPRPGPAELVLFETAVLAARYPCDPALESLPKPPADLPREFQRDLLELILTGPRPDKGLEILLKSGFLAMYWPELANLAGVTHAKDYHPEGDAWRHTLETFSHRKTADLTLSLALLLHDTGKPDAISIEGRRFDRHSELGERSARDFMTRLHYDQQMIRQVGFLVRYHMLPAALPRIPTSAVEHVLEDPLFPVLLELYRCDELSTFKGPDGYYEACAAYKAWRRNSGNPFRDGDGRKLTRNGRSSERQT
jgi:poly(A) polymerase